MKTRFYSAAQVGVTLLVSLAAISSGWALGFRNPDQGARATGQGEAFVAQADDASALYYNPAGLTQGTGTESTSGAYFDFAGTKFHGPGGTLENTATSFLPHFYCATDFGKAGSPWRVGLGFNVPFGNSTDWGGTGPFRYLVTKSSLAVYNIAPSVAYRVNEHLSLGVDLNVYHGETELERKIAIPIPGVPEAHFHFRGDGNAVGATVGALYKFNDQHALGAVYRSPFTINFAGQAVSRDAVPLASSGPSGVESSINFPQSVAVGYAYRPTRKLKLEVDVEWTNWESLNVVRLSSKNPNFDYQTNPLQATLPFNWKDSFFYEFGAQYELTPNWTARAGYIFSENTVPDSTFSPTLPDGDRHVLSAGLGWAIQRLQLDVVYQYSFTADRTVTGSPLGMNGKWTSDGHAVMFTSTVHF